MLEAVFLSLFARFFLVVDRSELAGSSAEMASLRRTSEKVLSMLSSSASSFSMSSREKYFEKNRGEIMLVRLDCSSAESDELICGLVGEASPMCSSARDAWKMPSVARMGSGPSTNSRRVVRNSTGRCRSVASSVHALSLHSSCSTSITSACMGPGSRRSRADSAWGCMLRSSLATSSLRVSKDVSMARRRWASSSSTGSVRASPHVSRYRMRNSNVSGRWAGKKARQNARVKSDRKRLRFSAARYWLNTLASRKRERWSAATDSWVAALHAACLPSPRRSTQDTSHGSSAMVVTTMRVADSAWKMASLPYSIMQHRACTHASSVNGLNRPLMTRGCTPRKGGSRFLGTDATRMEVVVVSWKFSRPIRCSSRCTACRYISSLSACSTATAPQKTCGNKMSLLGSRYDTMTCSVRMISMTTVKESMYGLDRHFLRECRISIMNSP
mmetsp:Transcript_12939/g.33016  ORF Transcript_12939/g.33016 Transcript_12939/m.33016 type:complete len:444 (-) Transcript_12939:1823-3154(-)